jgi:hypothetical protein
MYEFSTDVKNIVNSEYFSFFMLLEILNANNSPYRRLTTHASELTMSDGATYLPNRIISVDPPKASSAVDREQYSFVISDSQFLEAEQIEGGNFIGRKVNARIGFLNASGVPLTNLTDTFLIYSGRIDSYTYKIKTEEIGEVLLQFTCSSPMADLDLKKGIFLSKDFVKGRDPLDTSCDMIYGGSLSLSLKWGKS